MATDGRSIDHNTLEGYRFAAIKLHRRNVSVSTIAGSFSVTEVAVYRWLRRANEEGIRSLRSRRAVGPEPHLDKSNYSILMSALRKSPTNFGYDTDLWSGPRLRHFLKLYLGISYHPKHMPRLLRRIGLKIKFPERRALEQDPKEIRKWKRVRLPEIMEYARRRHGLVFYSDESLVSLIPYVGKTWTFPNVKPVARVSGKRGQHVGVTAAVNAQGRMGFELTRDGEKFTAKVFLRFVRKLRREYPSRSIILIVDGAPTHTANIVKDFQKENKKWFRLEILPAYSPELNPSEKPWNFLKTKQRNGSMAMNKDELRVDAYVSMKRLKKNQNRIKSFFEEKPRRKSNLS